MKLQPSIALISVVIFAYVNFTDALVGVKINKYCKEAMGNATTHKVLCHAVADRVTVKVYRVCRKTVTYACKAAKLTGLDYKNCKTTLLGVICPDVDALTSTVAPPDGSTPATVDEDYPLYSEEYDEDYYEDEDSSDEDISWEALKRGYQV